MLEWYIHGGPRGDGDGDVLKKYGRFIQKVKRIAAVVRELQKLPSVSEQLLTKKWLYTIVVMLPTLFCNKVIVSFNTGLDL